MTYEQETAWLAGLLEGEGCFFSGGGKNSKTNCMIIQLRMTDEDVVRQAAKAMETHTTGPYTAIRNGVARKPSWTAQISGKRAVAVARRVLPYMGKRRTLKIEYLLDRAGKAKTYEEISKLGVAARRKNKHKGVLSLFPTEKLA